MDKRQLIEKELHRFLGYLRQTSKLPHDYAIELVLDFEGRLINTVNGVKASGLCYAYKDHARIIVAGHRAPGAYLVTLAHEFKHVLQTAVEKSRLKKRGKAREAAAEKYADEVAPPYIIRRGHEEGCELLKDCADIWSVIHLCAS